MIVVSTAIGSNSIAIVNGRVVGRDTNTVSSKIDKTEMQDSNSDVLQRLVVDGKVANISLTAGKESKIIAHLHGECSFDGSEPTLSITKYQDEILVDVNWYGNYFSGELFLDIILPSTIFGGIKVLTDSGDISVDSSVSTTGVLQFNTQSGDITVDTECGIILATTMSGDVEVKLRATMESSITLQTMSGDVDITLSKVNLLTFSSNTMSGKVRNHFQNANGGHNVTVSASTMSGDIKVR